MAHPNLVFMGVCGCGKSTVAELYAQRTAATLIEADRTLGGVVEYAEIGAPKFDELTPDGSSGIKACLLPVVLHYSSAGPLN